MKKFKFALVDAFSDKPLAGNPCAVVFGADKLKTAEMLSIAKEMNQSETAFLMKSKKFDLKARYFTPEREIPLAGHPTIASIHFALEAGFIRKPQTTKIIKLELNDGPIDVEIQKKSGSMLIRMFQRKPIFGEIHDAQIVLPLFGLNPEDLMKNANIQTVSTGTKQLMVPLRSHEALKKLTMDVNAYKIYREQKDFFSPHFFCLNGVTKNGHTFARHIGVPPDTQEDAFTGSATGGMAAYLFKYGFLKKSKFIAEQGHWMGRPGKAFVEVLGSPDNIQSVSVAGTATTVIQGTLAI